MHIDQKGVLIDQSKECVRDVDQKGVLPQRTVGFDNGS